MIRSGDLQRLAEVRLKEAEALFAAGMYDGCVYLCGYVVEMALKACICKTLKVPEYPDEEQGTKSAFKTHDFDSLVLLAGLRPAVEDKRKASKDFRENWSLATGWKPYDRYVLNGKTAENAEATLNALRSPTEGVLVWLSKQW
jgi:HEPN domain-containing protein